MPPPADFLRSTVYIPGSASENPDPLARFLPPVPAGVIGEWMQSRIPPGSLVLDPFGASPRLAVEVARAGYWVLIAANNPIARFLLEVYAYPASVTEYRSALADLSSMRRGSERIEPHIRSLYLTHCDNCKAEIEAQAFLWERGSQVPYAKIYTCPVCSESDVHDTTPQDKSRAEEFNRDKLHRARALERVAAVDDTERGNVEEALNTYLPRAVYALFTLINKLDGITLPPERRRHLDALLLHGFDQANNLWAHPAGRARPKQLTVPPRFRENNIWMAMENAIEELASLNGVDVPLRIWPDLRGHTPGGITIYEGRLKDLTDSVHVIDLQAVAGAIPRPNQAFWTLSALWAGWLWGREAVGPFRSVLRRRRYDWGWHSTALHAAMENLFRITKTGTPFLGLIGEAEPGYISSALIAAQTAGFSIRGIALRAENGQAQIEWDKPGQPAKTGVVTDQQMAAQASHAALDYLKQRGEPASYLQMHTAAISSLAWDNHLTHLGRKKDGQEPASAEILAQSSEMLEGAFSYRAGFLRYGGSDKTPEAGQWWLREDSLDNQDIEAPLADRVEVVLVRYLLKNPGAAYQDVDRSLCKAFPGMLTPSSELIDAILTSYGQEIGEGGKWQIRNEDKPRARRNDLEAIRQTLTQIGTNLGYTVEGERPLLWVDFQVSDRSSAEDEPPDEMVRAVFYPIASTTIGEILRNNPYPPEKSIIVVPGSRSALLLYKMKRDAHLNQMAESGWRFLKFRLVYRLAKNPLLNRQNLNENLSLDPLQDETGQMRLL